MALCISTFDAVKCPKPNMDVKPTGSKQLFLDIELGTRTFDAVKSLESNMDVHLATKCVAYLFFFARCMSWLLIPSIYVRQ